jgi:hypothetical protein
MPVMLSVLRRLFVNCDEELEKAGIAVAVQLVDTQIDGRRILTPGSKMAKTIIGSRMGCALSFDWVPEVNAKTSSNSVEAVVRRLVFKTCPNVKLIRGSVQSLTASSDSRRITSAQIKTSDGAGQDLSISFLVDCTGPACGAAKWIPRASSMWITPEKDAYDPKVSYFAAIIPRTPAIEKHLGNDPNPCSFVRYALPSWKHSDSRVYSIARYEHQQRECSYRRQ